MISEMLSHLSRALNPNKHFLINTSKSVIIMNKNSIHGSTKAMKADDRRAMINSLPKRDEGSVGEKSFDMDLSGFERICSFPTPHTPNQLFEGIPYKDLPVVHIKATKNNTIMTLCHSKGYFLLTRTCGAEGFKNCRKGTNVAAQATALTFSSKIIKMGHKTVRLCIRGLGAGRMSSIKGLQMGGIDIVSITDTTPICEYPTARPPAARSL